MEKRIKFTETKYLTTEEYAKVNYLSIREVVRRIHEKKIKAKKLGGRWLIPVTSHN